MPIGQLGKILAIVATGLLPLVVWADCVKTVRWYDDAPYAFTGADGQPAGISVDLARATLRAMDCEAKFVEMPWARAVIELQAGRLDILPSMLRTPEREKMAYFSRPYNRSPNVLFIRTQVAPQYGIISDEVSALVELQQLGLSNAVVRSDVVVSEEPARFALAKASHAPDFVARFDKALGGLMADGKYKTILERYLPCAVSTEKLGCK